MNVFDAINTRRSIRAYKDAAIPERKLLKLLEAGRLAPSADNRQPWQFIVVKDAARRRRLAEAASGQDFVGEAAAVIVALTDSTFPATWSFRDPMIAVEHMVLEAVEEGLGTCWIGAFDEDEIRRMLKIPDRLAVVCLLPIGVPEESPPATYRKPFSQIFHKEEYGIPYQPS